MFSRDFVKKPEVKEWQTVVRVKTQNYMRGDSLFIGKSVTVLKRKSFGFDLVGDHIKYEQDEMDYINNISDVDDGVYELIYDSPSHSAEGEFDYEGFLLVEFEV